MTYYIQVSYNLCVCYPLFVDDRILFSNGAQYNLKGKISMADNWKALEPFRLAAVDSEPAIIQERELSSWMHTYEYRSLNVKTGERWTIPQTIDVQAFLTTPDGRYVAYSQRQTDSVKAKSMRETLGRIPVLKYLLYLTPKDSPAAALCLYEKPGKLRARLPFMAYDYGNYYTDPRTHGIYKMETARLSADGHLLYVTMSQGERREMWRFVW